MTNQPEKPEAAVIEGREPTAEENALMDWVEERDRKGLGVLTDTSRQLVLLTAALAGGGVALSDALLNSYCRVGSLAAILFALGAALYGMLPYGASVNTAFLDEVRRVRAGAFRSKALAVRVASLGLFAALGLAVLGLVLRLCGVP